MAFEALGSQGPYRFWIQTPRRANIYRIVKAKDAQSEESKLQESVTTGRKLLWHGVGALRVHALWCEQAYNLQGL